MESAILTTLILNYEMHFSSYYYKKFYLFYTHIFVNENLSLSLVRLVCRMHGYRDRGYLINLFRYDLRNTFNQYKFPKFFV